MSNTAPTTKPVREKVPIPLPKSPYFHPSQLTKTDKKSVSKKSNDTNNNSSNSSNNNDNNDNAAPAEGVIRIKRKRNEEVMSTIVVDENDLTRQPKKNALESLLSNFAKMNTKDGSSDISSAMKELNETALDAFHELREKRKCFRLAYTITDAEKIRTHRKGLHKIKTHSSRDKLIAERRGQQPTTPTSTDKTAATTTASTRTTTTIPTTDSAAETPTQSRAKPNTDDEDYVIDVYTVDHTASKKEIEESDIVRLETFDEELMFDHEYDEEEGYEDEDSNAEDNPNNDYPEEETDEENSDVDDIIQYDARRRGSRVYVSSSEDEGDGLVDNEHFNYGYDSYGFGARNTMWGSRQYVSREDREGNDSDEEYEEYAYQSSEEHNPDDDM